MLMRKVTLGHTHQYSPALMYRGAYHTPLPYPIYLWHTPCIHDISYIPITSISYTHANFLHKVIREPTTTIGKSYNCFYVTAFKCFKHTKYHKGPMNWPLGYLSPERLYTQFKTRVFVVFLLFIYNLISTGKSNGFKPNPCLLGFFIKGQSDFNIIQNAS